MRLVVASVIAVGLAACGSGDGAGGREPERVDTPVAVYRALDGTGLALNVAACNAAPVVADLRETADEVVVRVVADAPGSEGEDACSDGVIIELRAPLGNRQVLDATTGDPVPGDGG